MFYSVCLGNPTPCLFLSERCIWLPKTAVKRQAFLRDHSALFLVIAQFFTHLRCLIAAMIEIAPQITRIQSEEAVMFFCCCLFGIFVLHQASTGTACCCPAHHRGESTALLLGAEALSLCGSVLRKCITVQTELTHWEHRPEQPWVDMPMYYPLGRRQSTSPGQDCTRKWGVMLCPTNQFTLETGIQNSV